MSIYADNTNRTSSKQYSRIRGNYVDGCEVFNGGNLDLMNPYSNVSAIVCSNGTISQSRSTYPTEGGIFNCYVNPGYITKSFEASFWTDQNNNTKALDEHIHPELKQFAGRLFDWLTGSKGPDTGSDGDYAVSKGTPTYLKKISGSWMPIINNLSQFKHEVYAYQGTNIVDCRADNVSVAVYEDSYNKSLNISNNKFFNVENGIKLYTNVASTNPSYDNVIIKNNYIRLTEHLRPTTASRNGINDLDNQVSHITVLPDPSITDKQWIDNNYGQTSYINKLIIDNNILEIPVSSSRKLYYGKGSPYETFTKTPYQLYKYSGYYAGIQLPSDHSFDAKGRKNPFTRHVSIKNNKFINFYPSMSYFMATSSVGYTQTIVMSTALTSSGDASPYKNTSASYQSNVIPKYFIEDNTYNSPVHPSTASLSPVFVVISPKKGSTHWSPIKQVKQFANLNVNKNLSAGGSITGITKSFLIDHPTKPDKKLQYGSLESPYHGIRLTGKSKANKNKTKVDLPDYISSLVHENDINIQLTPYLCNKLFYVDDIDFYNNCFYVVCDQCENEFEFFWSLTAVRKDIYNLITEF